MQHFFNTLSRDISLSRVVSLLNPRTPQPFPVLEVGTSPLHQFFQHANGVIIEPDDGDLLRVTLAPVLTGPFDGTFAVTGDQSAIISANATAVDIEAALNGIASIVADGGVDVTGEWPAFLISYRAAGVTAGFTVAADLLAPNATADLNILTDGDSDTRELVQLTLRVLPLIQTTSFTTITSPWVGWEGRIPLTTSATLAWIQAYGVSVGDYRQAEALIAIDVIDAEDRVTPLYQSAVTIRASNFGTPIESDTSSPAGSGVGASGTSLRRTITQNAHGFSAKQAVYHNGTAFVLATANGTAIATARVVAVIESVTTNTFVAVFGGELNVSGLTANSQYYLSAATAGLLTTTPPSGATEFQVSVLRTGTTARGYVEIGEPLSLALIPPSALQTVTVAKGGTGLTALGTALQGLRVNAAGTALEYATAAGSGDLLAANNLSDVANAATARTNLGLGTAATTAASAYATATQGTTADAALAKASNLSDLTSASTARTNLGLGTLATQSGTFSGTSSGTNTGDQDLSVKVTGNVAITGATKTKVTYDTKGLVTAGADATTADIADSSNKRYVTDANLTTIGNQSGTNTGDQTNITGNAATVTTNANLTGPVTSVGNATTITDDAVTNAKLANANANTVKVNATGSADNPTDLAMAASTILARLASGNIVAATTTEMRALLALVIGTNVQAYDADLATWAGITPGTGVGTQLALAANGSNPGAIGYRGIPTDSVSADLTFADADCGRKKYHPSADTTGRTWTIDGSVITDLSSYVVSGQNDASAGVITIVFTNCVGVLAGAGTTGTRSVAANGNFTLAGMTSGRVQISGYGIT